MSPPTVKPESPSLSPGLNEIYERHYFFGELTTAMANTATITSYPSEEVDGHQQALPSMADWTLTTPPPPTFTESQDSQDTNLFLENNLNNFPTNEDTSSSSLLSLLTSGMDPPQPSTSLPAPSSQVFSQPTSPLSADTPTKQTQKLLNGYIGVLDLNTQTAEAPTFEAVARNRYACNLCKEVVNGVHEKFIHRNKHLGRTFLCTFCGTVFPTSIDVVRHIHIIHKNSQKCPKCTYVATDKDSYLAHMQKCHMEQPVPVQPGAQLVQHEAQLVQPGDQLIPPGAELVQPGTQLVQHGAQLVQPEAQLVHPPPQPSIYESLTQKPRKKRKASSSRSTVPRISKKHVSIEVENFRISCELCVDKATLLSSQQAYNKHVCECHMLPGQNLPYMCPFMDCFREFAEEGQLSKHLSTHTALRKYKCSLCKKAFKTLAQSKKHEDEVHTNSDLRPYLCSWPDCGKRFKASKHLQVHYMIHTDTKPILCECCDYRCRQRNSINYHYRTKHPEWRPPKIHLPSSALPRVRRA